MTDTIKISDSHFSHHGFTLSSDNLFKDAQGHASIGSLPAHSGAEGGYLEIPPIPGYSSTAAAPHLSEEVPAVLPGGPDLTKQSIPDLGTELALDPATKSGAEPITKPGLNSALKTELAPATERSLERLIKHEPSAGQSPNLSQELAPNWLKKELILHQGLEENPPIGLPVDPKTGLIIAPSEPSDWPGQISKLPPLPENPYAYIEQHPWMKEHHGDGDSPAEILLMMYQAEHATASYYSPSQAPPPPDIIWKAPHILSPGIQVSIPGQEIMD